MCQGSALEGLAAVTRSLPPQQLWYLQWLQSSVQISAFVPFPSSGEVILILQPCIEAKCTSVKACCEVFMGSVMKGGVN